jgi:hypothetical protein
VSGIQTEYAGRSQDEIHRAVCALSADIVKLRGKGGYSQSVKVQKLRQQRADLQALLNKPLIVWNNP